MQALLQRTRFTVDDKLDFVALKFGGLAVRFGYRLGFTIDQTLRLAAKHAATVDDAPASFWRELELTDLNDRPRTHREPRQSKLTPTASNWAVEIDGAEVILRFDADAMAMDYVTAIRLGHAIRRASQRAKAWAGDFSRYSALRGNLTTA